MPKTFHRHTHRSSEKMSQRSVQHSEFGLDIEYSPLEIPEMSVEESKKLVDRLYKLDHYRERELQKELL